jgi:hypothetical protein
MHNCNPSLRMQTASAAPAPLEREAEEKFRRATEVAPTPSTAATGREGVGAVGAPHTATAGREGVGADGAPRIIPPFRHMELLPPPHQLAPDPTAVAARSSRSRGDGGGWARKGLARTVSDHDDQHRC